MKPWSWLIPLLGILLGLGATVAATRPRAPLLHPGQRARGATNEAAIRTAGAFWATRLPLGFEPNRGQTDRRVRFLAHTGGGTLFLASNEAVLAVASGPPRRSGQAGEGKRRRQPVALRMRFVGANPAPALEGLQQLPGKVNYFLGSDPKQWRANIPTYARVRYREVYPGIDLLFYGRQQELEYDFVVAPGADPRSIRFRFEGSDRLEVDAGGDLLLHTPGGILRQLRPRIYQEVDGLRRSVAGGYVLAAEPGKPEGLGVSLQVASYDRRKPLVIDPTLVYSTYLGGNSQDEGHGIAVDASGSTYVTGRTSSPNFPTTAGALDTTSDSGDAFVAKINPAGSALVYSTYLGGSSLENQGGKGAVAVDGDGNASLTGITASSNFPTIAGAFQPNLSGAADAFVAKLNATGSALLYSTYLGGSATENGGGSGAIAVEANGFINVAGDTPSSDFPTTAGAFQPVRGGSSDAFVARIDPTQAGAASLLYSTYLGGSSDESLVTGIAVDPPGGPCSAYVTGRTASANFPTTAGAFDTTLSGFDAFVAKIDPSQVGAASLVYSTFLGGSSFEIGSGVAVDAAGSAYVTGGTASDNFPTTAGAFRTARSGGFDAFVTRFNAAGTGLVYSTFLGGGGFEAGAAIAVDGAGNAYVAGTTTSADDPATPQNEGFPLADPLQAVFGGGGSDAFVTKFNPAGSALVYSTYLGGSSGDQGRGIAADASANAYVTGMTNSVDDPGTPANEGFPLANPLQATFGGGVTGIGDAFAAKISDGAPPPTPPAAPSDLTATAVSSSQINLQWRDNSDNETVFEVERKSGAGDFAPIGAEGANTSSFEDMGLSPNTTFTYRVRARNAAGPSGYTNEASATTLPPPSTAPAAPSDLTAAACVRRVLLGWSDNSKNEERFEIERQSNGGSFSQIAVVGANVSSYADRDVPLGSVVTYRVRAANAAGTSGFSNEAGAATPPLSARGRLKVTPEEVHFDPTGVGHTKRRKVDLKNVGRDPISVCIEPMEPPFRVPSRDTVTFLAPRERRSVRVDFRPQARGRFVGTLVINSTAAGTPVANVRVVGHGAAPP